MKKFISIYLTSGIKPTTKEPWFRMSTQLVRGIKSSFDIGNLSYSKIVKGGQQPLEVIHSWFLNDMTLQSYSDMIDMNGGSNEFKIHIPSNPNEQSILLTQEEYQELQRSDVSHELEEHTEQPSL
tara:strand:+ start:123 stop:497 length:375 start_codon:yes stop_codon:yes gene_type:complete